MDHQNHDKVFFSNFAKVLGALFGIFFICIVAARIIDTGEAHVDPQAADKLAARLKPVGVAVTDPNVLLAMAPAKVAHEPFSGDQVVAQTCTGCHGAGVMGAPKIGDGASWGSRLKAVGGRDGLVASAIKGKNAMPPRGGNADLTDAEVKAAVEEMLKKSGV